MGNRIANDKRHVFRSVGLLIFEKPLPLLNGRPNRFILTDGKHPEYFCSGRQN